MKVLGGLGPDAREAIPALIEQLKSVGNDTFVDTALGKIGKDAVPALIDLLSDPDALTVCRWHATLALGKDRPRSG